MSKWVPIKLTPYNNCVLAEAGNVVGRGWGEESAVADLQRQLGNQCTSIDAPARKICIDSSREPHMQISNPIVRLWHLRNEMEYLAKQVKPEHAGYHEAIEFLHHDIYRLRGRLMQVGVKGGNLFG